MSKPDELGLTPEAARGYETFFVPAIFDQWPARMLAAANVSAGDDVLDVGCGTGVLTREAVKAVGETGSVTGFDLSESMLGVAREVCPAVTFRQGNVAQLPFDDASFDAVVSSFMLMFTPDPSAALQEIRRVLRPGGRVALSVWQGLTDNPVYGALVEATRDVVGDEAARLMAWPFAMGDRETLSQLLGSAGLDDAAADAHDGHADFPSVEELVRTEVQAWLLADDVSDTQIGEIVANLRNRYADFADSDGPIRFPLNAIIANGAAG